MHMRWAKSWLLKLLPNLHGLKPQLVYFALCPLSLAMLRKYTSAKRERDAKFYSSGSQCKTKLYHKSRSSRSGRHEPTKLPWVTRAENHSVISEWKDASRWASEAARNIYHSSEHGPQLKIKVTLCSDGPQKERGHSHLSRTACWGGRAHEARWAELPWPGLSHPAGAGHVARWEGGSSSQHPRLCSKPPAHGGGPGDGTAAPGTWSHGCHQGTSHGAGWSLPPVHPLTRLPPQHRGVTEGRRWPHRPSWTSMERKRCSRLVVVISFYV